MLLVPRSRRSHVCIAAAIAASVLALTACGGKDNEVTVSATTVAPATTATTAAPTTAAPTTAAPPTTAARTTTAAAHPTTTSRGTSDTTTAGGSGDDVWNQRASEHRGAPGQTFSIDCTPNGHENSVWGTETYTDDSSICTAAVHVGLITFASGGTVQFQMAPGLPAYVGTLGNGVTTSDYTAFDGSFIFPAAPPGSGHFEVSPESWSKNATAYHGQNAKLVTVDCSADGNIGSVWGTGTYTDDSSVCTAAVQAGLLTTADGGRVVIEIAPGANSYKGSTANGVTSQDYDAFDGSFTFPKDQSAAKG